MEILNNNYYIIQSYNDKKLQNKSFGSLATSPIQQQQHVENSDNSKALTLQQADAIKAQSNIKTLPYRKIGILKTAFPYETHFYKLENGQRVLIIPKKGPTIVKTYINTGSMNEPDEKRGISHFIEHNLFNGTEKLAPGEFFNQVSKIGASTNASTGFSQTDYYISSQLLMDDDFEKIIELHSDMLQNPTFQQAQIEKEKGPVTSEISMVGDDPLNYAINSCIKNLYQIKTNSKDLVAGNISNIENISQEDLKNYYAQNYMPSNMVTVVTGEVDPDTTIKLIAKKFNKKESTQKPQKHEKLQTVQKTIRQDVKMPNTQVAIIMMGFDGPENSNAKDKIATELLLSILGSATSSFSENMDKLDANCDFGIERIANASDSNRTILINLTCDDNNSNEALKTLYKEIIKIQNNEISMKQIEFAKRNMKNDLIEISESTEAINSVIGNSLLDNDLDYLMNYETILDSITQKDLQNAAKRFLNLNQASITVVHPEKTHSNNSNKIAFGGKYVQKDIFDEEQIQEKTIKNNIELTLNPTEIARNSVYMVFDTKYYPNINPTCAFVLSEMLNRGNSQLDKKEFANTLNEHNTNLIFTASQNSIETAIVTDDENFEFAVGMMNETLQNPRFTKENFDKSKASVKKAILASNNPLLLQEKLFPNLPHMKNKEELLMQIDNLKIEDVLEFYNFILSNAQTKCTASLEKENLEKNSKILQNELESLPQTFQPFSTSLVETFVPNSNSEVIFHINSKKQADILRAYKFEIGNTPEEKIKLSLLNIVLGGSTTSRLFNDLRETQKLAYRVNSDVETIGNTGVLSLHILTTTDDPDDLKQDYTNVLKSLQGFDNHVENLKNITIEKNELEEAKKILKTSILDSVETSFEKTIALSKSKDTQAGIYNIDYILSTIDLIEPEDILEISQKIFNEKPITAISASEKTINSLLNIDRKQLEG